VRIEKLRQAHKLRMKWIHFPLHPDTPQEGRSLADLFAGEAVLAALFAGVAIGGAVVYAVMHHGGTHS
jgi:hypothetical protein